MFQPGLTEWPILHTDREPAPTPRGGVAPLRHDLALARYLEEQAEHRIPARQSDIAGVARILGRFAHDGLILLRALRLPLSQQRELTNGR